MHTPQTARLSLPRRLRRDGWWFIDPPRPRPPATLLAFVPRARPGHAGPTPEARA